MILTFFLKKSRKLSRESAWGYITPRGSEGRGESRMGDGGAEVREKRSERESTRFLLPRHTSVRFIILTFRRGFADRDFAVCR